MIPAPWLTVTSCSLTCFKQHKDVCREHDKRENPGVATALGSNTQVPKPPSASILEASTLQALFLQYPSLKSSLQHIYHAAGGLPSQPDGASTATPNKEDARQQQRNFQAGLRALQNATLADETAAQGIAALMELLPEEKTR